MQDDMEIYDGNTSQIYTERTQVQREKVVCESSTVTIQTGLFAAKTFAFMAGGLAVSFVVAFLTSLFFPTAMFEFEMYIGVLIAEIAVAVIFGFCFQKLSAPATIGLFFVYAVLTGFTLSLFLTAFGFSTFYLAFASTGCIFLVLSIVGFVTKKDVGRVGPMLGVTLIMLCLTSVIAYVIGGVFEMIVCGIGVLIFSAITVYDIKKMRNFEGMITSEQDYTKYAVYSAMQLFLDFINILIYIIRILAVSNRRK